MPGLRTSASPTALIVVLGMLTAFGPLATDLYLPGFHLMAESFGVGDDKIQVTLSVFFLGLALGQAVYGPLIDRYGRRTPLLVGIGLYVAATLSCLLTSDILHFTVLRFLQAVGGCAGMVIGRAVVSDLFEERESARALSLLMIVMTIMPIVAPTLGGLILAIAGWRAIFVVILGFGFVCAALTVRLVPETLAAEKRNREPLTAAFAAYGRLLRHGPFLRPVLTGAFALGSMFAFIGGSPFVFIKLFGVGEQAFGYLFGLIALGLVVAAQANRTALAHWRPRTLLSVALAVNVTSAAALVIGAGTGSLIAVVATLWLAVASVGFIGANSTAIAMAKTGTDAGSGSALIGVLQFGCAFVASSLVAALQNGTAYPMATIVFLSGLLAAATWASGRRLDTADVVGTP